MKYLRIYKLLLKMNLSALVAYRENFINSVVSSVAWGCFSLFSIVLLTSKTSTVFGWSRQELLLLNGIYGVFIGVFHTLFSRNFERFSTIIHYGQLDSILIKPINTQFLVSLWIFNYASLSRIIIAGVYVTLLVFQMHIHISLYSIVYVVIFGTAGIILLYSLWYIVTTLVIWYTQLSNLVDLMFTVSGMARYPQEMYHQLANYLFFFLFPLTLIITIPTKIMLQRVQAWEPITLFVFAILLLFLSKWFWSYALRFYTSASS